MRMRDVRTMPGLEGRGGEGGGGGGRERGGGERMALLVIFFFVFFFSVGLRIDDVGIFASDDDQLGGKQYPRTKSFDRYNKLENSYRYKDI